VAIIRVEQLYPFPHKAFAAELKKYPNAHRRRVVPGRAAEPGRLVLRAALHPREHAEGQKLGYAGRPASASPAVGYAHLHQEQQKALLDQAFGKLKGFVLTK
jgi:2-oxoglutarate dehydrogenase E1 component